MKSKEPSSERVAGQLAALKRAAQEALELARRTNTPCYVMKGGHIVDIAATPERIYTESEETPSEG